MMCIPGRTLRLCAPFVLFGVFAGAQAPSAADPTKETFPLSEKSATLNQAAIDEAVAAAKAVDVDVSTSSAILYHGLTLFQDEKYTAAIPFLEEALRQDPSLQSGWEALGWAYRRTGEPEKGHRLWAYFRQLMPDQWMPYNLLAQEAILNQDWPLADQNFKKALQIKPDLFDLSFWYAQNLLRLGKPDEAEKIFRKLIKQEPDRLDIQINLANLLIYKLEYDEAVEIYRRVNDELPGNVPFMMTQASLELRVGETRTADQLCLDVLNIETNNLAALTLRADIAEISDMTEMSVDRLQKVIDSTTDPLARAQLRLRLSNRCAALNERSPGLFSDGFVLGQIRKAIDDDPNDVVAQVLYAERCVQAKRYAEAKKWAIHVLERFNRYNVRAKNLLFEVALVEQNFDGAEQILNDRFSDYDPTDPMRYYYEARLLAARGAYNEALKAISRMEAAAKRGTVLTLLYHDLTESDWIPVTSVRRLREQLFALKREGFSFISPTDIPEKLKLPLGEVRDEDPEPPPESVPWTALLIDNIRYGITGERKFKTSTGPQKEKIKPMKLVAITFDGGLRSSLLLGSAVAEEAGVPFGMFVGTKPTSDYMPSIAGWDEIAEAAASGAWVVGSALYGAQFDQPIDLEGKTLRHCLPNRVWLPEKKRLESMNEWDRRMRAEFRESRKALREHLSDAESPVQMVAYPYGDLGQERTCNLSLLRNPVQSIVSEASRNYTVGFVQSASGYTTAGDNLLLCRRLEPNWFDEGADLVRQAYENHPLFMAWRTRVEIAFLMNRPHMAEEMLDQLRRSGYPEDLCNKIMVEVQSHFRNRPLRSVQPLVASSMVAVESAAGGGQTTPAYDVQNMQQQAGAQTAASSSVGGAPVGSQPAAPGDAAASSSEKTADVAEYEWRGTYQQENSDPWVYLSNPFVGGEISHSKANDQFEILRYGGRGGVNLNRNLRVSAEYFESHIEQRIRPRWNAIDYDPDDLTTYLFKAFKREVRGRLSYRTSSGATLSGSLGVVKWRPDNDDNGYGVYSEADGVFEDDPGSGVFDPSEEDDAYVGDLSAYWAPRDNLTLYVFYARDLVTSAVKMMTSDSVGGVARWQPSDAWIVNLRTQYWSYEDDNALFHIQGESYWEMMPELGIWMGLDLSTVSSSDASDYYWTPYWDQRALGVLRYMQAWQGYSFRFDVLGGFQRADGRPIRRTEEADLSAKSDWELVWGASSTYNKRVFRYVDLFVDGSVMALRDYIDHRFLLGFNLGF